MSVIYKPGVLLPTEMTIMNDAYTNIDLSFERVPYDWESRKQWLEMPFPMEEYEVRLANVRKMMAAEGFDALLIYGGISWLNGDIRYLSNFYTIIGNTIIGVPLQGEVMLATDSIFHFAPMHSFAHLTWIKDFRPGLLPGTGVGHGGGDPDNISRHVRDFIVEHTLADKRLGLVGGRFIPAEVINPITAEFPKIEITSATMPYWRVKSIKSPREIVVMEEAASATAKGLEAAMERAEPEATELDVAAAASEAMARVLTSLATTSLSPAHAAV